MSCNDAGRDRGRPNRSLFVRHRETGIVVDRLPPGASCVECEADAVALDDFIDAIDQAQDIDRPSVRAIAAEQFNTSRVVDEIEQLLLKIADAARVMASRKAR